METATTMGMNKEHLGIDYAIITLIIAYILGTIVQALIKASVSVL